MSGNWIPDDIWKSVENFLKESDKWWKDWLRNNYGLAVAANELFFMIGRQQTRMWLGDQYRKSLEDSETK